MSREEILLLIDAAIDEINAQTSSQRRVAKSEGTVIVGAGSSLDSLGIINLLVSLEAKVAGATGHTVNLLNDDALNDPTGSLHTVASIAEYILQQIQAETTLADTSRRSEA